MLTLELNRFSYSQIALQTAHGTNRAILLRLDELRRPTGSRSGCPKENREAAPHRFALRSVKTPRNTHRRRAPSSESVVACVLLPIPFFCLSSCQCCVVLTEPLLPHSLIGRQESRVDALFSCGITAEQAQHTTVSRKLRAFQERSDYRSIP
jgi:hypothetical protein